MRIFTFEPLSAFRSRLCHSLYGDDRLEESADENVYEDTHLPYGNGKETDIYRLVKQHRIRK